MTKDGGPALNEKQFAALRLLASHDNDKRGALTGAEIAASLWRNPFTSYEQGQRACKRLQALGLAEPLGYGPNNARTWAATDAGRAFIAARETTQ